MTILIDMDDTIENLTEAWCNWLNIVYDTNVEPEDITSWDVSKFFPTLTKKQVFSPMANPGFWKTVEPREDAIKYVKKLIDDGNEVYICTTSNYKTIQAKFENVIMKHFPYIDWDHMIITSKKQLISADYLIDDGVHNLIGGNYGKILMDAPHNCDYDEEQEYMIRVNNWEEIYNILSDDMEEI